VTDYYKYAAEIPDTQLIERLLAGHPDAGQLFAIISRSYDYIQKLPLKGISENYFRGNSDLFELVL
jgi:hypothetical protein